MPILIFKFQHFLELAVIILNAMVFGGPVDYDQHPHLDVVEILESLVKVLYQLWHLIGTGLADVALIDHQNQFHLFIDIEQPLHKETVRNLKLLTFVVFEARAVIESHAADFDHIRDGSFRKLLVAYFNALVVGVVQSGLKTVILDDQLTAR